MKYYMRNLAEIGLFKEYGNQQTALKFGVDNWNKVLSGQLGVPMTMVGLTKNTNWWPENLCASLQTSEGIWP